MGDDGEPPPERAADDELALRADVPQTGAETEGQADGDDDQRRGFDGELLQAVTVREGLDEIDLESLRRRLAEQRDDKAADEHRDDKRGERGQRLEQARALRPGFEV